MFSLSFLFLFLQNAWIRADITCSTTFVRSKCFTSNSPLFISGALAVHNPQATSPQQTFDKQGFIISHRDYPDDYTASITSSLIISGLQPQQIVRVKFLEFQIYYSPSYPGCDDDYLQITGSGGQTFCSDPQHQPVIDEWYNFTATDSPLEFTFVTNGNRRSTDKGFYLQYKGEHVYFTLDSLISTNFVVNSPKKRKESKKQTAQTFSSTEIVLLNWDLWHADA